MRKPNRYDNKQNSRLANRYQRPLTIIMIESGYFNTKTVYSKQEIIKAFSEYPLLKSKDAYVPIDGSINEIIIDIGKKFWYSGPPKAKKKVNEVRALTVKGSTEFLKSYAWKKLRYQALLKYEKKCMCCGRTPKDGVQIHVDHIKPRKRYPGLALDINNLQILCGDCNHGKGNWDETDHR